MVISKGKARKVAREDAEAAAKLLHVQELQIAALEQQVRDKDHLIDELNAKVAAAESLLIVLAHTYDYVDGCTGEIVRAVWQQGIER